jgi:MFS family permease
VTATQAPPAATAAATVPRAVKGLSVTSLFNDFASEMVYPLLPAFVTGTLGGGAITLGALDGAADLTSAFVKWGSGRLADRPGWRTPLILLGYATAVLMRPLVALTQATWQVIGVRVADRVGKGLRTPARDALIADLTAPAAHGRAFGFHRGADHFGAVLGSLVAWLLLQRGAEVRQVIGWSVVPGVIAVAVLAVVLRGSRAADRRAAPVRPEPATLAGGGRVFLFPVLALTALTCFRLPETLLILRLQDLGVPVAAVPLVWAALHVVRSVSSYPGGWLSDRVGPRRVVAAGGLLFALVAVVLGASVGPVVAAGVFMALGFVAGLTEAAERAVVARLAPARLGRGFGVYHALTGLAALPAGLGFGLLYQHISGTAALLGSAAGMAASVVLWIVVSPRAVAGKEVPRR